MKHIWSPWRMPYVEDHPHEDGCIFCLALSQAEDSDSLILFNGVHAFIILNRYPYVNGHMMVVPYSHVPSLEDLDPETQMELMHLAVEALGVLRETYGAQSFNIGVNIGEAAGAGVEDHVHIHVLPRWSGDTSFMATTAHTRVVPEGLDRTHARLSEAWSKREL